MKSIVPIAVMLVVTSVIAGLFMLAAVKFKPEIFRSGTEKAAVPSSDSTKNAKGLDSLRAASVSGDSLKQSGPDITVTSDTKITALRDSLQILNAALRAEQEKHAGAGVATQDTAKAKERKNVAKVLESMQAENAAKILQDLTDQEVKEILTHVKKRQAAKILAALDPARASRILR